MFAFAKPILAHLSRRFIGELIVYPCSGLRSSVHLLRNRLANQRQILCGASMGKGTKVCLRHLGNMTEISATPKYGNQRTHGPVKLA